MAKRKAPAQKEKLLEVATVDVAVTSKKKITVEKCPDPFPLYRCGTPCRGEDRFDLAVNEIAERWEKSQYNKFTFNTVPRISLFREFVFTDLQGETVPGVTTGKFRLLFETVEKILNDEKDEAQQIEQPPGDDTRAVKHLEVQRPETNRSGKQAKQGAGKAKPGNSGARSSAPVSRKRK